MQVHNANESNQILTWNMFTKHGNVQIITALHSTIRVYSTRRLHPSTSTQKPNLLSLTRAPIPNKVMTEVTKTAHSAIFST